MAKRRLKRAGRRYVKPSKRRNQAPTLEAKARSLVSSYRLATDRQESLTLGDARVLLGKVHHCPYCTRPLSSMDLSWDHIIPRARGGTSDHYNLVLCHRDCNRIKGALTAEEFNALRRFLAEWPEMSIDVEKRLSCGGLIFRKRRR